MKSIKYSLAIFFVCGIFAFASLLFTKQVFGQEGISIGIAKYFPIAEQVEDGDIVAIKDNQYYKSSKEYDVGMIGVVTINPALEINDQSLLPDDTRFPIMSSGTAYVKVTTKDREINKGDLITSSSVPGIAMKSVRPGIVLGVAEENVPISDQEFTKMKTSLQIHYSYSGEEGGSPDKLSFTDIFAITRILQYQSPSAVLKYLFAAFVVIVSIVFGYFTFARIAARGIEAVGRNPLASKAINVSIVVNVTITIAVVVSGLLLAYFIITL